MSKSLYDMILESRQLSNTQRNPFVTNPEIGNWVNKGIKALYDAICEADRSYYNATQDYTLAGTSSAAATGALPADFYLVRGVTRFPDTRNACPVFARNFTLHDVGGGFGGVQGGGDPGYLLTGNNLAIVPYSSASSGPWRLTYVPKAPQLTIPAVIAKTIAPGADNISAPSNIITIAAGTFSSGDVGSSLFITGTVDPGNSGEFVITAVFGSTGARVSPPFSSSETLSTAVIVNEGIGPSTRLDVTMDNFDSVPPLWAAIRIIEKKKQDPSTLVTLLAAELQRVAGMTSGRQAEPEAAPTLWQPSGFPIQGFGPFGSGNEFGP